MALAEHDDDLLVALHTIGAADGLTDFAVRTCRELLRLVPGVRSSYNEVNSTIERIAALVYPDPGREFYEHYATLFQRYRLDNPIIRHFEEAGEPGVVTWSDLDPTGAFLDTPLYREFYAPYGIHGQIAVLLPLPPGRHVALVVNRGVDAFTDRERALLAELQPHLANLYRLVSYAEASRQRDAALADDGWTVIIVDDGGTVLDSNDLAVSIGRAAGVDLGAGASLADGPLWSAVSEQHMDLWARSGPTVVRGAFEQFEARLVRSAVGPHLLWIREPSRVSESDALALGLTPRQAQVGILLVDGLTNDQIAARLEIAPGTVRKHVTGLFERLGVPSRAAAVGRLMAAL